MGRQIIKQPNGKYAIWSTIVDDFILEDITPEEYIEILVEEKSEEIKEYVTKITSQLEAGKKPYHHFTKTYEEALEIRNKIHNNENS